jgi:hypothetical protein
MRLHIGMTEGYNNILLTANSNMKFGINENINARKKRDTKKEENKKNIFGKIKK